MLEYAIIIAIFPVFGAMLFYGVYKGKNRYIFIAPFLVWYALGTVIGFVVGVWAAATGKPIAQWIALIVGCKSYDIEQYSLKY